MSLLQAKNKSTEGLEEIGMITELLIGKEFWNSTRKYLSDHKVLALTQRPKRNLTPDPLNATR